MEKLTSEQANQLSNNFLGLAQSLGDYRYNNWNNLSAKELQEIGNLQFSLMHYAEDILAFSATLVMEEVSSSLNTIQSVTTNITQTLQTLKNVQKVINIAAACVTLGAAILSKDTSSIGEGIKDLVNSIKITDEEEKKGEI